MSILMIRICITDMYTKILNMAVLKSISIFILAGFCEIGGGYLVWLWLKEGKPIWFGLLGGLILSLYGVVATLQTSNFARVYALMVGFSSSCLCCGLIKWITIYRIDLTLLER